MKLFKSWVPYAVVLGVATMVGVTAFGGNEAPAPAPIDVVVYKNPSCGCCAKWIDILKAEGFNVEVHDTAAVEPIKERNGIPTALWSCHTAFVEGYVIEGHVPVADIRRLLREKPKVAGLTVPGMVVGSPGMEIGNRKDPYEVLAFGRDGKTEVWARH